MNKDNINIANIISNVDLNMELYSPIFGVGKVTKITDRIHVKFVYEHNVKCFDYFGRYSKSGECMLFPKDYKDWETYLKDIHYVESHFVTLEGKFMGDIATWICIQKGVKNDELQYYFGCDASHKNLLVNTYLG